MYLAVAGMLKSPTTWAYNIYGFTAAFAQAVGTAWEVPGSAILGPDRRRRLTSIVPEHRMTLRWVLGYCEAV